MDKQTCKARLMADWQNRIIGHGVLPANQFAHNPSNPRKHPDKQRKALKGSLDTLGWIAPVIVNARTGYLIDGHERVWQALAQGEETSVPFIEIDLSEAEEAQALATFDFITAMAEYDRENLDALLREFNSDDENVQALLADMATEQGLNMPDEFPEFDEDIVESVEFCECPNCGHKFLK